MLFENKDNNNFFSQLEMNEEVKEKLEKDQMISMASP